MDYKQVTEELKRGLTVAEVIARLPVSLNLKPRGTDRLIGDCITGHTSSSHTCFHVFTDYYHCKSCDTHGNIFQAVIEAKGCSFVEAKNWLIDEFRQDLGRYNKGGKKEQATGLPRGYALKGILLEELVNYGKKLLYQKEGEQALQYLTEARGYELETLKKTEFFYLLPDKEARAFLLEKFCDKETSEEVRKYITGNWEKRADGKPVFKGLSLSGAFGDNFRLAFPYRNSYGTITGLIKRALQEEGVIIKKKGKELPPQRWDSSTGVTKEDLFNLYKYHKGQKELLLVEGYPDALYFAAMGIPTAAVGQGQLSRKHLTELLSSDIKEVTLSLDNDGEEKGEKQTRAAIKLLREEAPGITLNIVPPKELGEAKDLDEYYRSQGEDALKAFLKSAPVPYYIYQFDEITEKHTAGREEGLSEKQLRNYLQDVVEHSSSLPGIDKGLFLGQAEKYCKETGLRVTGADFLEAANELHSRKEEEKLQNKLSRLQADAKRLLEEGSPLEALKLLEDGVGEVRKKIVGKPVELLHSWEDIIEDFTKEEDALKTGYKSLDKWVRIPRAVNTVIAGKPSHGKTTFMLNLVYKQAKFYPGESFFFFSYEEPRAKLYTKLLSVIVGEQLSNSQSNLEYLRFYLRERRTDNEKIEAAKEELEELVDSGRLQVLSTPYTYEEARPIISQLKELGRHVGACYFDYIQKIPGEGKDIRNRIVGASGELLKAANESGAAVILGSQFNRAGAGRGEPLLSDLNESSSIEQDASLVLSIYNSAMDAKDSEGGTEEELNPKEYELKIKVLKQRERGNVGRSIMLDFNAPLQLITDPEEDSF
jgi:replicative DNA helicase